MTSVQAMAIKLIDIEAKKAKKAKKAVLNHTLDNGYTTSSVYLTVTLIANGKNSSLEYGVY